MVIPCTYCSEYVILEQWSTMMNYLMLVWFTSNYLTQQKSCFLQFLSNWKTKATGTKAMDQFFLKDTSSLNQYPYRMQSLE